MNSRFIFIYVLLLFFLLTLPIQTFAQGDGDDHSHGPEGSPWLRGQKNGDDDHSHGPVGSPWLDSSAYEEPGANVPLLGTFAVINVGFILYGAVRKYHKRKK